LKEIFQGTKRTPESLMLASECREEARNGRESGALPSRGEKPERNSMTRVQKRERERGTERRGCRLE